MSVETEILFHAMTRNHREGRYTVAAGIADALLYWIGHTHRNQRGPQWDEHRLGVVLGIQEDATHHLATIPIRND
jgi:hypothetical protein